MSSAYFADSVYVNNKTVMIHLKAKWHQDYWRTDGMWCDVMWCRILWQEFTEGWRQIVSPSSWLISTRPHGLTYRKTMIILALNKSCRPHWAYSPRYSRPYPRLSPRTGFERTSAVFDKSYIIHPDTPYSTYDYYNLPSSPSLRNVKSIVLLLTFDGIRHGVTMRA